MSKIEHNTCDFCHLDKPVERTYLRPTLYKKPEDLTKAIKLYNEGNYFIIIRSCSDCGKPKI
jgi:hypothetical protein